MTSRLRRRRMPEASQNYDGASRRRREKVYVDADDGGQVDTIPFLLSTLIAPHPQPQPQTWEL